VSLGRLVPPGDPDALAEAVLEVLENPPAAQHQAEAAREWAVEHFTIERTVDAFRAVWASCAARA
jgi:glycosyltransferase involved in cell wall biosynthesis